MCSWVSSFLIYQDIPEHLRKSVLKTISLLIVVFSKVDHHNSVWQQHTAIFMSRIFLQDSQILIRKTRNNQAESEQLISLFCRLLYFPYSIKKNSLWEQLGRGNHFLPLQTEASLVEAWVKHSVSQEWRVHVAEERNRNVSLNVKLIQHDLILRHKGTQSSFTIGFKTLCV